MPDAYVPALGRPQLTGLYDQAIALMTRERVWRSALLALIAPKDGEMIVDVGAGTGTLAIALARMAPGARIVAVDPDPAALAIARAKALKAGVSVEWTEGMGDALLSLLGEATADKAVSSLVFHQCIPTMKLGILRAIRCVLRPGGELFVADYGLQRSGLMRLLFRQVQMLDGWAATTPNALGHLPGQIGEAGFRVVEERRVIGTPTGSLSLYTATAPR